MTTTKRPTLVTATIEPLPRKPRTELSLAELVALGLLCEAPAHGWSIARSLAPDGEVGRVWSCSRPLVYRALDALVERKLARAGRAEKSSAGPQRLLLTATAAGRRAFETWRATPVEHVRDVRSELMLKLLLTDRAGADSTELLRAQRSILAETEVRLERHTVSSTGFERTVALSRLATARAALSFVEALLDQSPGEPVVYRSIGSVRSAHASLVGMPLQPIADTTGSAIIEIGEPYRGCLADLDGFSHVWIIAHLHEGVGWTSTVPAFLDDEPRGTLATRSPHRPNPIGLSLAGIVRVEPDSVVVSGIDLLDGTPVLDLKPHVPLFDTPADEVVAGWFEGRAERVFERTSDGRFSRRRDAG